MNNNIRYSPSNIRLILLSRPVMCTAYWSVPGNYRKFAHAPWLSKRTLQAVNPQRRIIFSLHKTGRSRCKPRLPKTPLAEVGIIHHSLLRQISFRPSLKKRSP